ESWILLIVCMFGFWGSAAFFLFFKKDVLKWSLFLSGMGLLLSGGLLVQKELQKPFGVVTAAAKAYSGPAISNVLLFELHEGTEFHVDSRDESGWIRIELADGKKGWVEQKSVLHLN